LKDSPDLECLKVIAKETLIDSGRYLFEDIKKRTINELISLIEKELSQRNKHLAAPTIFIKWQAGAIAQAVFELAESLETVGAKESTLNQIDVLRRAIVYILNKLTVCEAMDEQSGESPAMRKLSVVESKLQDLLKTILERIVSYYRVSPRKSLPAETAVDLRRLTESLQHFAGEFKEHIPFEMITDEIRSLADDLRNVKYVDEWIKGRAANISIMLSAIYDELHERSWSKAILTNDEEKTKSYVLQTMEILRDIAPRSLCKLDSEKLHYFADKLAECPDVAQFLDFWRVLKQVKGLTAADGSIDDLPAETEQKATSTTFQKIWTRIKRIPRWICGLIIAVVVAVIAAIVVDIFTDFGWIKGIKGFIYRIVSSN